MAWSLVGMRFPRDVASVADLDAGFAPAPLGSRATVIAALTAAFPELDYARRDHAAVELDGAIVEIRVPEDEDPVEHVGFRITGGGAGVLPVVAQVCALLGVRAVDAATGEFADGEGWAAAQDYRDRTARGDAT